MTSLWARMIEAPVLAADRVQHLVICHGSGGVTIFLTSSSVGVVGLTGLTLCYTTSLQRDILIFSRFT